MLGNGTLTAQRAGSSYATGQTGQISESHTLTITGVTGSDGTPNNKISGMTTGCRHDLHGVPYSPSTSSTTNLYKVVASYPDGSGRNVVPHISTSAIIASYSDLQGHAEIVTADPVAVAPPVANHPSGLSRNVRYSAASRRDFVERPPRAFLMAGPRELGRSGSWKSPSGQAIFPFVKHALPQQ